MFGRRRAHASSSGRAESESVLLGDLDRALAFVDDPRAIQRVVTAKTNEFSGCYGVVFCGFASADASYRSSCQAGLPPETVLDIQFDARGALAKWLRVNDEPLVFRDRPAVLSYLPVAERTTVSTQRIVACVPLVSADRMLAMLCLVGAEGEAWQPTESLTHLLGAIGRHAAVACDRAATHQAERERLESSSRAQQLAVAGQVAAAVAHEVRNPLTTIRSSVQFVIDSSAHWSDKSELLRQVIQEVDRVNRSVSGVLSLSRRHEATFEDIELHAVIDGALTSIAPYFDHHRLSVQRCLTTDDVVILGDIDQLRQVVLNVFMNACEATPPGGCVTVSSAVEMSGATGDDGKASVVLTVSDTGRGISLDQQNRVFEPFFTTKANGTGLGLSICAEILARHAGTIRLQSQPGQGASAIITLPLRRT